MFAILGSYPWGIQLRGRPPLSVLILSGVLILFSDLGAMHLHWLIESYAILFGILAFHQCCLARQAEVIEVSWP